MANPLVTLPPKPPHDGSLSGITWWWLQTARNWMFKMANPAVSQTASFTPGDDYFYPINCTGGAITVTLPLAVTCRGKQYLFKKTDTSANAVTVNRAGSDTIDGATSATISAQYSDLWLVSDGTSTWHAINVYSAGGGTAAKSQVVFLTTAGAGTFNVPANVTEVIVTLQGAGGAGGSGSASGGGGGGGGGQLIWRVPVAVTGGGTLAYVIGTKGSGVSNANGGDGTDTTVGGGTWVAKGGKGGVAHGGGGVGGGSGVATGGAGGTFASPGGAGNVGVQGTIFAWGGSSGGGGLNGTNALGGAGAANGPWAGGAGAPATVSLASGGGGGASAFGPGADAPASNASTNAAATSYGAGGSGTSRSSGTPAGGNGCDGLLIIEYIG